MSEHPSARRRSSKPKVMPELEEITYKNLAVLYGYIDNSGRIVNHKLTGFDASRQRRLQKAVKRARALGLLPYSSKVRF